jgi:hypothetical protein
MFEKINLDVAYRLLQAIELHNHLVDVPEAQLRARASLKNIRNGGSSSCTLGFYIVQRDGDLYIRS